jgi:hypothetical protein
MKQIEEVIKYKGVTHARCYGKIKKKSNPRYEI